MPPILSKILMPEWNVPYNCYELGHTWTPFCSEAALEVGMIVFTESLKLYTPLYLANQVLFSRKFDGNSTVESLRSILRSSAFLGINAFLVIAFFCLSRHFMGRFYYLLVAGVPGFIGSLLAILVERPSRRRALAFYVANIASETAYRILASRGYISPIPGGRAMLFTGAIVSLIFMFETGALKDPLLSFVFRLVIGYKKKNTKDQEVSKEIAEIEQHKQPLHSLPENDQLIGRRSFWYRLRQTLEEIKSHTHQHLPTLPLFFTLSHPLCPHHHQTGCLEELTVNGLVKPFLLGYGAQLAFGIFPKLLSLKASVVRETLLNRRYLLSSRHASTGLFLAAFTAIYKGVRCGLRWSSGANRDGLHSVMAGLTAVTAPSQVLGLAGPSTSVTLYLVWKTVEAAFSSAARRGLIPVPNAVVHVIYAMACAELFYAAVLDPRHIKPSYKRFLDRVTRHKLGFINRNVLEVFGTNASAGYEAMKLPIYDLAHTTRRFQESVLVWLL